MTPGPPPKPTAAKRTAGNPGRHPLNTDEPEYRVATPKPPAEIAGDALAYWNEVVPDLVESGALTVIDHGTLVQCCLFWGQFVTAVREVEALGSRIYTTNTGYRQQDPWIGVQNTAYTNYQKAAQQLGITPASRTKVRAVKPTSAVNPWEALKGGRESG